MRNQTTTKHRIVPTFPVADFDLIGTREAAALLGLAVPTIYSLCCKKVLPFYKIGKLNKFSRKELNAWIAARQVSAIGN